MALAIRVVKFSEDARGHPPRVGRERDSTPARVIHQNLRPGERTPSSGIDVEPTKAFPLFLGHLVVRIVNRLRRRHSMMKLHEANLTRGPALLSRMDVALQSALPLLDRLKKREASAEGPAPGKLHRAASVHVRLGDSRDPRFPLGAALAPVPLGHTSGMILEHGV